MVSADSILAEAAKLYGYQYLSKRKIAFGSCNGYNFILQSFDSKQITATFFIKGEEPNAKLQAAFCSLKQCTTEIGKVTLSLRWRADGNINDEVRQVSDILQHTTSLFFTHKYANCDALGIEGLACLYCSDDKYMYLTDESAETVRKSFKYAKESEDSKKENFFAGLFGAVIAGLVSSLLILIVALIGFVSSFTAILMGCALVYGYKWKGVRLSLPSAALCVVLSAVMSYLVFRIDVAVSAMKVADLSFGSAFLHSREVYSIADSLITYYGNLVLVSGIAIIGTVLIAVYELKSQKSKFEIIKLS